MPTSALQREAPRQKAQECTTEMGPRKQSAETWGWDRTYEITLQTEEEGKRRHHRRLLFFSLLTNRGFPGGSVVANPPANTRDTALIPGSERSPGGGNGNPL